MDQQETYGGAAFVPTVDNETGKITTDQAARVLAEPGFPLKSASVFFRNCARDGLVHPYSRQKTGKRAYYFRADALVTASILHRIAEAAIADGRLRNRVALSLNSWNLTDLGFSEEDIAAGRAKHDGPRSPAMWALVAYLDGTRDFAFEIRTCRHASTGALEYDCRLHTATGQGTNFRRSGPDWKVRSAFVVAVDDVLDHLTRQREILN